jgi:hypothetical protein
MRTKLTLTALALLLLVAAPVAAQTGLQALRDDANGFLCYDFRAWGQCFAYTPTAGGQATAAPSATTAPGVTPATATATPTATVTRPPTATATAPSAQQPELLNGGFEQDGGWVSYFLQTSAPGKEPGVFRVPRGDGPFAGIVYEGQRALQVRGEYMCWRGGAYQRVPVVAGQALRLTAWADTWSNSTDLFEFESDVNTWQSLQLGIDPKGGTDPANSRIEWTERYGGTGWQQLTVDTYAAAPFVTVFLYANLGYRYPNECMWPLKNNWGLFDTVTLVAP